LNITRYGYKVKSALSQTFPFLALQTSYGRVIVLLSEQFLDYYLQVAAALLVCNSLVGQAHPSESCRVLTLTLWPWIPGQTLIAATSTASFVQNPSCQVLTLTLWVPWQTLIAATSTAKKKKKICPYLGS